MKINTAFCLLAIVTIFSCKKDDNVPVEPIKPEPEPVKEYAVRPTDGFDKFYVRLDAKKYGAIKSIDSTYVNDYSVLYLPENYSEKGPPVNLVIYFHGAGSAVNPLRTNISLHPMLAYLAKNGFAILDTNGYPPDYWEEGEQTTKCAHMGGQLAIESHYKAYQYSIDKYNINKDRITLIGTSMGGLTSTNFMNNYTVDVASQVLEAPIVSLKDQAWDKPWFGGAKGTRFQLAKFYYFQSATTFNFTAAKTELDGYFEANIFRLKNYDPINTNVVNINGGIGITSKTPLLVFHSVHDKTSVVDNSEKYTGLLNVAAPSIASLVKIDDGNIYSNQHAPFSFTSTLADGTKMNRFILQSFDFIKSKI